jgi:hypothetical protein
MAHCGLMNCRSVPSEEILSPLIRRTAISIILAVLASRPVVSVSSATASRDINGVALVSTARSFQQPIRDVRQPTLMSTCALVADNGQRARHAQMGPAPSRCSTIRLTLLCFAQDAATLAERQNSESDVREETAREPLGISGSAYSLQSILFLGMKYALMPGTGLECRRKRDERHRRPLLGRSCQQLEGN